MSSDLMDIIVQICNMDIRKVETYRASRCIVGVAIPSNNGYSCSLTPMTLEYSQRHSQRSNMTVTWRDISLVNIWRSI